jgi:hypothetical protein
MGDSGTLEYFVKAYHFHLLRLPKKDAFVGDVYSFNGRDATKYGSLTDLLGSSFESFQIQKDKAMTDIVGKISKKVSLSFSINLLGEFFKIFGASNLINTIRAEYESKKTRFVKFSFSEMTYDYVNPVTFAKK